MKDACVMNSNFMNIKYFTWEFIRDGVCEGGLSGRSLVRAVSRGSGLS